MPGLAVDGCFRRAVLERAVVMLPTRRANPAFAVVAAAEVALGRFFVLFEFAVGARVVFETFAWVLTVTNPAGFAVAAVHTEWDLIRGEMGRSSKKVLVAYGEIVRQCERGD